MGKHSSDTGSSLPLARMILLALGTTLTAVAWGYLVKSAIGFGVLARDHGGSAWAYLALATLGAIACAGVALILLARLLRTLGIVGHDRRSSRRHSR